MALTPIKDLSIFLPNRTPKPEAPSGTEVTGRFDLSTISKDGLPFAKNEQPSEELNALTGTLKPKATPLFG